MRIGAIFYTIDITLGVGIEVRMERGLYPELPLVIHTSAHLKEFKMDWSSHRSIFQGIEENLPYKDAGPRIHELLPEIFSKHKKWDRTYITKYGENEAEFRARLQKEKEDENRKELNAHI